MYICIHVVVSSCCFCILQLSGDIFKWRSGTSLFLVVVHYTCHIAIVDCTRRYSSKNKQNRIQCVICYARLLYFSMVNFIYCFRKDLIAYSLLC